MTENHIMESLSTDFIRIIAHNTGYTVTVPERDYGIDLFITKNTYKIDSETY